MRRAAIVFIVLITLLASVSRANGSLPNSPYTQLILHVNATTTITLVWIQQAGQCALANSSTNDAAVNFGTADKTSASSCASYAGGSTYSLTSDFGIEATCSGTCTSFDLSIALASTAQTNITWKASGTTVSTTKALIASSLPYGQIFAGPIEADVKTTPGTPPNTVQQAIVITATANGVSGVSATATLNAEFVNRPGISIFLSKDASGVPVTGGAFAAALNFGTVSAFGSLPAGVTRSNVTASNYTVTTVVDIDVVNGNVVSSHYTMQSKLESAAAAGITYAVNSVAMTTSPQVVTSVGNYGTTQAYTLNVVISTLAPGLGGPAVGSALADTLDFTATAN